MNWKWKKVFEIFNLSTVIGIYIDVVVLTKKVKINWKIMAIYRKAGFIFHAYVTF